MTAFIVKIDGTKHAPGGICHPASAADWEAGTLIAKQGNAGMEVLTRRLLNYGPPRRGDRIYVWTHETARFGHGLGLTATATADEVRDEGGHLAIVLAEVALLDSPIMLSDLRFGEEDTAFLESFFSDQRVKTWILGPGNAARLEEIVLRLGFAAPAPSPEESWQDALREQGDSVEPEYVRRKPRPGQPAFRLRARARHGGCCVISDCPVREALEAAHVIPHTGNPLFERADNALLLRRDLHGLLDAAMIAIDPSDGRLLLSKELAGTEYADQFEGMVIDHKLADVPLAYQFTAFTEAEAKR